MAQLHKCRRVYNNGDTVLELRDAIRTPIWLEYNSQFRPGCALFIDGILKESGYYKGERLSKLCEQYATDAAVVVTPTK